MIGEWDFLFGFVGAGLLKVRLRDEVISGRVWGSRLLGDGRKIISLNFSREV